MDSSQFTAETPLLWFPLLNIRSILAMYLIVICHMAAPTPTPTPTSTLTTLFLLYPYCVMDDGTLCFYYVKYVPFRNFIFTINVCFLWWMDKIVSFPQKYLSYMAEPYLFETD